MITLTKKDWPKLQWGVGVFVLLAATGAGIVYISGKTLDDANKANQQAKSTRDAARAKASRADQEAIELQKLIAVYQEMQTRGIIGQEHRLDWIEKIRKIKLERKLIDLNYELLPQELVKADVVAPSGQGFDIMSSPMKLKMSLLHENDLLGLLSDLRNNVEGYIRVRRCDVDRSATTTTVSGPVPQLHADCDLDWITVREKL